MTLAKALKENPDLFEPVAGLIGVAFMAGIGAMVFFESRMSDMETRLRESHTTAIEELLQNIRKLENSASPEESDKIRRQINSTAIHYIETDAIINGKPLGGPNSVTRQNIWNFISNAVNVRPRSPYLIFEFCNSPRRTDSLNC